MLRLIRVSKRGTLPLHVKFVQKFYQADTDIQSNFEWFINQISILSKSMFSGNWASDTVLAVVFRFNAI